jgi:hypothetical protein
VVPCLRQVLAESLRMSSASTSHQHSKYTHSLKGFLDGHLLRADEAADGDRDGKVDVVCTDVVPEAHPGTRLRHTDHALEVADRDRERACCERFAAEVCVQTCDLILIDVEELRFHPFASVHDVLAKRVLRD